MTSGSSVRGKFRCNQITDDGQGHKQVQLSPAGDGGGQGNWDLTTNGPVEMTINQSAADLFSQGGEYELSISPAS